MSFPTTDGDGANDEKDNDEEDEVWESGRPCWTMGDGTG